MNYLLRAVNHNSSSLRDDFDTFILCIAGMFMEMSVNNWQASCWSFKRASTWCRCKQCGTLPAHKFPRNHLQSLRMKSCHLHTNWRLIKFRRLLLQTSFDIYKQLCAAARTAPNCFGSSQQFWQIDEAAEQVLEHYEESRRQTPLETRFLKFHPKYLQSVEVVEILHAEGERAGDRHIRARSFHRASSIE